MRVTARHLSIFSLLLLSVACTIVYANEAGDDAPGTSYYVYQDGEDGYSGDAKPSGDGGVFNFNDYYLNSSDDALMDESIAAKMNLDEKGNPIVVRLMHGANKYSEVALTFDDGPHPKYTSRILSILQHYRIHATFFMVGFMANRNPHWAKQVAQLGNEVGNHTYDHFRLTSLPEDEVVYQIRQTQDVIYQITGKYPRFIRPPGGRYDQAVLQRLAENGLAVALWTHNTKDLDVDNADAIFQDAMRDLESGSIILMHDGSDVTIEILPRLIEAILAKGYTFVTLSEMLDRSGIGKSGQSSDSNTGDYEDWRKNGY
jgi:peptidoglycan/xylan/chitin deacetylase (PgdA/CDA1 family)